MNLPPEPALRSFLWKLAGRRTFSLTYHNWYRFRRFMLRLFGARVSGTADVRPSAAIDRPWNLTLGEHVLIGDHSLILARSPISIGDRAVVSQRTSLLTEARDPGTPGFPVRTAPITIGADAWIATDTLVMPGVTVHEGAVVGARSMVDRDVPAWRIAGGDPAAVLRERRLGVRPAAARSGEVPG